jgi:hypothetical protein
VGKTRCYRLLKQVIDTHTAGLYKGKTNQTRFDRTGSNTSCGHMRTARPIDTMDGTRAFRNASNNRKNDVCYWRLLHLHSRTSFWCDAYQTPGTSLSYFAAGRNKLFASTVCPPLEGADIFNMDKPFFQQSYIGYSARRASHLAVQLEHSLNTYWQWRFNK